MSRVLICASFCAISARSCDINSSLGSLAIEGYRRGCQRGPLSSFDGGEDGDEVAVSGCTLLMVLCRCRLTNLHRTGRASIFLSMPLICMSLRPSTGYAISASTKPGYNCGFSVCTLSTTACLVRVCRLVFVNTAKGSGPFSVKVIYVQAL